MYLTFKSYVDNFRLSTEKAIKVLSVESTNFLYLFGVVNMHRYAKNQPLRGHFRTKVNIEEFERKKVNGPILQSKPETKESLNPMLGSLNYEVSPI